MTILGFITFRQTTISRWVREAIKDDQLADELQQIEGAPVRDPGATRRSVREAIERKYTAPASAH